MIGTTAAIIGASVLGAGASMLSGNKAASASTQAANTQAAAAERAAQIQADAANRAVDIQHQQFETTRGDYAPWREAGANALKEQTNLLGLNGAGEQTNAFSRFRTDPGYDFTRSEAIKGVDRSAAARGLTTSGATIKAIQDRASNLADQSYGNYFNRFGVVAGTGQTATNSTATAGAQAATNEGNALIGGAQARASGFNTAANAQAGGLINSANAFTNGASGVSGAFNSGLNNYFSLNGLGGGASAYSGNGNGEFYGI